MYCHILHCRQFLKEKLEYCTAGEAVKTEEPCSLWDVLFYRGSGTSGLLLNDPVKAERSTGVLVAEKELAFHLHLHCVPVFLLFPCCSSVIWVAHCL